MRGKTVEPKSSETTNEPPSSTTGGSISRLNLQEGNTLDLDKLAYAVAVAETGDCTEGMGVTKNNCFGIMTWPNGVRTGKWYPNKQASYEDFKRIWAKNYKRFPDFTLAHRWTGGDRVHTWLANVKRVYYK